MGWNYNSHKSKKIGFTHTQKLSNLIKTPVLTLCVNCRWKLSKTDLDDKMCYCCGEILK